MSNALETAIYSTLAGGTALTAMLAAGSASVFNGQPPRDAVLPWVQMSYVTGAEENATQHDSQRLVYLVKGVAGSLFTAGQIADKINALLHHCTVTVTGSTVFWSARDSIVRYSEGDPAGHPIGHAGGTYTFRLETA